MRQVLFPKPSLSAVQNFINAFSGEAVGIVLTAGSLFAAAGKYGRMHFRLATSAPGAGNSYTFTIRINNSNTSSAVTISGATDREGVIETQEAIAAGDIVEIEMTKSGTPTNQSVFIYGVFNSGVPNYCLLSSTLTGNLTITQNVSEFLPMTGLIMVANATQNQTEFPCPTNGTVRDLYVDLNTAPGTSAFRNFYVLVNGTRRINVGLTGSSKTGNSSGSFAVSAGDLLTFEAATISGGIAPFATKCRLGCVFEADNAGEFIIPSAHKDQPRNNGNSHGGFYSGDRVFENTGGNRKHTRGDIDWLAMYVNLTVAPGSGTSRRIVLRKVGSLTSLDLTISDTATTGNVTSTVAMDEQAVSDYRVDPTGVTASTHVGVGLLAKFNARVANPMMSNF